MGHTSFLTGSPSNTPQSLEEALYQLENCSLVFLTSWQRVPPDLQRAGRVSIEAMTHLDHIANEILRARDTLKAQGSHASSPLKVQLDIDRGLMTARVTRAQQNALISAGPGQGVLPGTPIPISLEKVLNKIKHRHHAASNFRVDPGGRHIFVINVDKRDQTPDAIVEFDVIHFCSHCKAVALLV
jgi:hypothetical protein